MLEAVSSGSVVVGVVVVPHHITCGFDSRSWPTPPVIIATGVRTGFRAGFLTGVRMDARSAKTNVAEKHEGCIV